MNNNWSYLAGIIDGEGTICIYYMKRQNRVQCQIVIPNTSEKLMKWLVTNFGGKYDTHFPKDLHGFNRKPLFRWQPAGKKNREKLLLGTIPHLVIKREQAKLALEFERLGYGELTRRQEIATACSKLNNGDESVETNTLDSVTSEMIESDLAGDCKSHPMVT